MLFALISAYPLYLLAQLWSKKPRVYFQKIVQQYFKLFYLLMPNSGNITIHNKHNSNAFHPCVYVSSHQSSLDYTLLATVIDDYVTPSNHFISDYPLFLKVPRHALGVHYIPKGDLSEAGKGYQSFIQALQQDSSVIIFPEGTRNPSSTLKRFKGGAFRLAVSQNVPLVPVLINGTGKIVTKGSNITKTVEKKDIHITFLDPIYPEKSETFATLAKRVKDVMQTHINNDKMYLKKEE
jgi:1-acyl-sn-glycerol-3-phosphate acyltransferase